MLQDDSLMPWGAHQGKAMANVPDDYLKFLWDKGKCWGEVKDYIILNLESIKRNLKPKKAYSHG